MRKANYDKYPATRISGNICQGWDNIIAGIKAALGDAKCLAVELYTGVYEDEVIKAFSDGFATEVVNTRDLMKPEPEIVAMTERFMTGDVLFGYVTALRIEDYFDAGRLGRAKEAVLSAPGLSVVVGTGASLVVPQDAMVVYVDMARWEIQQRFRRHEVKALGVDNRGDAVSVQYKRGYFNDWRICDIHKDSLFRRVAFWIDTHIAGSPKMIDRDTFFKGIDATVKTPFRVVPFFDPAPWGGQWMKEVCDLDRSQANFGWCFDCVPEENSLYFEVDGVRFELPSVDLVLLRSKELLGEPVEARFGKDFPIRFDFLDTMGGGNLSLQVHPTTQFIRENFGMAYTQDESYYLLDAGEGAHERGLDRGDGVLVVLVGVLLNRRGDAEDERNRDGVRVEVLEVALHRLDALLLGGVLVELLEDRGDAVGERERLHALVVVGELAALGPQENPVERLLGNLTH